MKDTALSENGRGAAWHVLISLKVPTNESPPGSQTRGDGEVLQTEVPSRICKLVRAFKRNTCLHLNGVSNTV
jgi:hypothetical protein